MPTFIATTIASILKDLFGQLFKSIGVKNLMYLVGVLAVAGAFYGYGEYRYGLGKKSVEFTTAKAEIDQLKAATAAYKQKLKHLEDQNQKLDRERQLAETQANQNRVKAETYYSKLQESNREYAKHLEKANGAFTVGFVGLYNLAVQGAGGSQERTFTVPEIISAAQLGERSATAKIGDSTKVTGTQLIDVNAYNMELLNTCLEERATVRNYFKSICDLGMCVGVEPVVEVNPNP